MPKNDPFLDPPKNPLFWGFWGVPREILKIPQKTLKNPQKDPPKSQKGRGLFGVLEGLLRVFEGFVGVLLLNSPHLRENPQSIHRLGIVLASTRGNFSRSGKFSLTREALVELHSRHDSARSRPAPPLLSRQPGEPIESIIFL